MAAAENPLLPPPPNRTTPPQTLRRLDRQEIAEQGPIFLGGNRDQLRPPIIGDGQMNSLQAGRLTGEPGAVVHDLAIDLTGRIVNQRHGLTPFELMLRGRSPTLSQRTDYLFRLPLAR